MPGDVQRGRSRIYSDWLPGPGDRPPVWPSDVLPMEELSFESDATLVRVGADRLGVLTGDGYWTVFDLASRKILGRSRLVMEVEGERLWAVDAVMTPSGYLAVHWADEIYDDDFIAFYDPYALGVFGSPELVFVEPFHTWSPGYVGQPNALRALTSWENGIACLGLGAQLYRWVNVLDEPVLTQIPFRLTGLAADIGRMLNYQRVDRNAIYWIDGQHIHMGFEYYDGVMDMTVKSDLYVDAETGYVADVRGRPQRAMTMGADGSWLYTGGNDYLVGFDMAAPGFLAELPRVTVSLDYMDAGFLNWPGGKGYVKGPYFALVSCSRERCIVTVFGSELGNFKWKDEFDISPSEAGVGRIEILGDWLVVRRPRIDTASIWNVRTGERLF